MTKIENVNFTFIVISDIHLGHRKTTTIEIIDNLNTFFNNYQKKPDYDAIFITGDVFDSLLDFAFSNIFEILNWIKNITNYCQKYNLILRILEGTPSHDWKQSRTFTYMINLLNNNGDIKYISDLNIEYIPDLNINILYIPDEWSDSVEETSKQVQNLLNKRNLRKVDITLMHGQFNYQMPEIASKGQKHNEDFYINITNYYIIIGHIHTHSVFNKIIAPGSFDRTAHGEEEAKGGVMCSIKNNKSSLPLFIENKSAKKYVTLNIKSISIEKTIKELEKKLTNIPDGSYVRLVLDKLHPFYTSFNEIDKVFPFINFSKTTKEDNKKPNKFRTMENFEFSDYTLTKDNISQLILTKVVESGKIQQEEIREVKDKIIAVI